jgi:hypothetical protein
MIPRLLNDTESVPGCLASVSLFICDLFNDAVNMFHYIVSNDWMI